MNNGEFLKEIGSKIRTQREMQKLSQKQLAIKCGLDPGSFWRIEVGQKNCYLLTLRRIATALDISIKDLM